MWIVISQDCDVVHHCLLAEPEVELIRLTPNTAGRGDIRWGKNPRHYQFALSENSYMDISIHDRARVDRAYLISAAPDGARVVPKEEVNRICRWIGQRYNRAAFPDEFNRRIKAKLDKVHKRSEFRNQHHLLTGLWIQVEDDELSSDMCYEPHLIATMNSEDYAIPQKRESATRMCVLIEAALGTCDGITLHDEAIELKPEQHFSLDMMRSFKRWDFDDLSVRDDDDESLIPPG